MLSRLTDHQLDDIGLDRMQLTVADWAMDAKNEVLHPSGGRPRRTSCNGAYKRSTSLVSVKDIGGSARSSNRALPRFSGPLTTFPPGGLRTTSEDLALIRVTTSTNREKLMKNLALLLSAVVIGSGLFAATPRPLGFSSGSARTAQAFGSAATTTA